MTLPGPKLVVLSGPSGSGKTTISRRLEHDPRLRPSISATTRPKRPNETDGIDYYFLTHDQFRQWIAQGEFIEHAEVFGNLYGTPRKGLEAIRAEGKHPLLDIDVQGVRALRQLGYPGVYVFLTVPDRRELQRRLSQRGTAPDEIERRVARYDAEMAQRKELYDFEVENRDLERTIAEVERILRENLDR